MKKIRDPVHKDIYLNRRQMAILDTPQVQRLRGIRQLGTAYWVYPGASHSRFEHCLGTFWMAGKIISALQEFEGCKLPEEEKQGVLLAALTHDVTHVPFGHTFEDERKLLPRHDMDKERFDYFFREGSLARTMEKTTGGTLARQILDPSGGLPDAKQYLKQIVDGTICADLLDYLKRDNYYCGLSQLYDERLFHYFSICEGRLALRLHQNGIFRRDALSEITHLLRIRYVLSERVYYHHAKIAAGAMISKAIERALLAGMQREELYSLQDEAVPLYLLYNYGRDSQLRELLDWFRARKLFKRCYMLTRRIGDENVSKLEELYHHNNRSCREELESNIAESIGAGRHEIAVYCPSAKMALKEATMPSICSKNQITRFCDLNSAEVRVLQQQHRELWKFFVFISPRLSGQRKEAAAICEEMLGLKNEIPRSGD